MAADALRAMVQLDKTARLIGSADLSAAELNLLQQQVFETLRFEDLPTAAGAPPAPFTAWQGLQALLTVPHRPFRGITFWGRRQHRKTVRVALPEFVR